jgi:hypothetical protein
MTTDDSPAIGGQSTDDSPMISSVQTRAIADARGAYLARNLDALIGLMSAEQQHSFRRALAEMALYYLEPLPPERWYDSYRERCLAAARAFLAAQTPEEARVVREAWPIVPVEPSYDPQWILDEQSVVFVRILDTDSTLTTAAREVRRAAAGVLNHSKMINSTLISIFKRRQLDAAWDLLCGHQVSLARGVEQEEIDAALADAAWMYRDRNLFALVRLMSYAQQLHLKRAAVHQAIESVEALWYSREQDADVRALLDAARRWCDAPSEETLQSARILTQSLPEKRNETIGSINQFDEGYAAVFHAACAAALNNPQRAAQHAMLAAYWGRISKRPGFKGPSNGTQWLLDAAWSILHDQELPRIQRQHDDSR